MSSLFEKPPAVKPPEPMPDPEDEQVKRARRRAVTKARKTGGVESTVLTGNRRENVGA